MPTISGWVAASTLIALAAAACVAPPPQSRAGAAPQPFTVAFDENGVIEPRSVRVRDEAIAAASKATDVFVLSHGWRNDEQTADCRYREMDAGIAGTQPPDARPLFIHIMWPSAVLPLPHDSCGRASLTAVSERATTMPDVRVWASAAFPAATRSRDFTADVDALTALMRGGPASPIADRSLNEAAQILARWRNAAAPGPAMLTVDAPDEMAVGGDAAAIVAQWRRLQKAPSPSNFQALTWFDFLEVFSFWTMKDRAGVVGSRGVAPLIQALLPARDRGARIHLVGHSFGGKLLSAALAGGATMNTVDSLVLLQCAMSHFALSTHDQIRSVGLDVPGEGAYASILRDRLAAVVVATYSTQDVDNRRWFPLGARVSDAVLSLGSVPVYAAIGARGVDGPPVVPVVLRDEPLPSIDPAGPLRVFNVDASDVILGHSDIAKPPVYRLIADAVRLSRHKQRP